MLSSTELIDLANKHKETLGIKKATYQEGVMFGYLLYSKELKLMHNIIKELEKRKDK